MLPTFEIKGDTIPESSVNYYVYTDADYLMTFSAVDKQILGLRIFENVPANSAMPDLLFDHAIQEKVMHIRLIAEDERNVLVPGEFFTSGREAALQNWVRGNRTGVNLYKDEILAHDAHLIYGVNQTLTDGISTTGLPFNVFHANTVFIQQPHEVANEVLCILRQRKLKVIVYKNHALQLVQDYSFLHPADACYHVLNALHLHGLDSAETPVKIGGMIETSSPLYKELERYIKNLEALEAAPGVSFGPQFAEYPAHYFNHLSYMV